MLLQHQILSSDPPRPSCSLQRRSHSQSTEAVSFRHGGQSIWGELCFSTLFRLSVFRFLIVLIKSLDCAECLTCICALCNNTDSTKQVKFQFLPAHFWDYFVSSGKPPSKFHIKRMIFCVLIKPPLHLPNSKKIYNCTSREQYYQIIKSNLPNTKV